MSSEPPPTPYRRPPPVRVPRSLEIATSWSWRLLLVGVAVYAVAFLVLGRVRVVAAPLLVAVLIAALLTPLFRGLLRLRVPRYVAAGISVAVFSTLVIAAITVVSQQIASQLGEVGTSASDGLEQALAFVADVLGVSLVQVEETISTAVGTFAQQSTSLLTGAVIATGTATSVLTGILLTLFAVFFYLADGARIWDFLVRMLPQEGRQRTGIAGRRAWSTLAGYVRAVPVVALVDAVGIGGGAAVIGVPFAIPIAVITFIGAFVPLVGAIVTGALAVLVALVTKGLVTAIIMLVIVFGVQQLESYVLQPLLLGRAVELYPLAVVTAITTGIVLAGIVGGVLAVPLLAMTVAFIRSLASPFPVEEVDWASVGGPPAAMEQTAGPDGGGEGAPLPDAEPAEAPEPMQAEATGPPTEQGSRT